MPVDLEANNGFVSNTPAGSSVTRWGDKDDIVMMMSREVEWAEAYLADNPDCEVGAIYLKFVQRELSSAIASS